MCQWWRTDTKKYIFLLHCLEIFTETLAPNLKRKPTNNKFTMAYVKKEMNTSGSKIPRYLEVEVSLQKI